MYAILTYIWLNFVVIYREIFQSLVGAFTTSMSKTHFGVSEILKKFRKFEQELHPQVPKKKRWFFESKVVQLGTC